MKVARRNDRTQIKCVLGKSGHVPLPMLELIEGAQASIDELTHETAVAQLLLLSAQELLAPSSVAKKQERYCGTAASAVSWRWLSGSFAGCGCAIRAVARPTFWPMAGCATMNIGNCVRDIMVAGVSTWRCAEVLPRAAGTVWASKISVSRHFTEASAAQLTQLKERSLAQMPVLVIYIDGICVDDHHVIAAAGVDNAGDKHLLGLSLGTIENAQVVKVTCAAASRAPRHFSRQ